MARKYVAFMPVDPRVLPERDAIDAVLSALIEAGVVQGDPKDPASLRNGPKTEALFRDTDPKRSGDGHGTDAGHMTFRIYEGEIAGFAGDNLEPVACIHCNSELPYNCAQDAFWALREGKPIDDPMLSMECYHCGKTNAALDADWGRSGGFARIAFLFEGETSNRVEANREGLGLIAAKLGAPVRFVQVHSW
jgi:hypothetical protein